MAYINLAALLSRISFSAMMLTHGYPKLIRLISGDHAFADPLGLGVSISLFLAVVGEFFCPLFVAFGFKTRLSSIPPMITMIVAAFVIHGSDPWNKKELAVMYLIGFTLTFLLNSGKYSLDHWLRKV